MELADGTYTVLARADRAPSAAVVDRFGGLPVDDRTVAFRSAGEAVRCAVALAREAPGAMGLHAGEINGGDPHDARPVGGAAGRAALARGGRVLASALVRELGADAPEVRMLGARGVSLPGLAGRMPVHDVSWGEPRRALRVVIA